jgi:hypothetical protein
MKDWKKNVFSGIIVFLAITAMAFTTSKKKGETQSQTATAEQTQTVVTQTVNPHPEISNGDLSALSGIWINNDKDRAKLSSDGVFDPGGWGNSLRASDFKKSGEGVNEIYSWANTIDGDGFSVTLYPIGTEVVHYDGNILQTDTTRVRIAIGRVFSSDHVYYWSEATPAPSQSKVWEPAELTGEWHSRSITDGCYGQEHYIFTADGYYRKGDLYQKHDGTWNLKIDAATGKYHLTLQYKHFIDFESGWTPNDFTQYAEYETIDPNNIDLLLHGTGWVELTRCHNPGWNAQ